MKLDSPCHGCPNRTLGCHSTCPRYALFNAVQVKKRALGMMYVTSSAPIHQKLNGNERRKKSC